MALLAMAISVSHALVECPPTMWDVRPVSMASDTRQRNAGFPDAMAAPIGASLAEEFDWLTARSDEIMHRLSDSGAVIFRGFSLPKTKSGFRGFCDALPLQACADPLSSIGVRSLLSNEDGV